MFSSLSVGAKDSPHWSLGSDFSEPTSPRSSPSAWWVWGAPVGHNTLVLGRLHLDHGFLLLHLN